MKTPSQYAQYLDEVRDEIVADLKALFDSDDTTAFDLDISEADVFVVTPVGSTVISQAVLLSSYHHGRQWSVELLDGLSVRLSDLSAYEVNALYKYLSNKLNPISQ